MVLDPVAVADQARQPIVRHRDVQIVRIVIADVLPVHFARAVADRAERLHFLKPVGRDLSLKWGHHFGHRRQSSVLQPDEHEPAPVFNCYRG